jgi:flagellar hook-basal body complex protein FliE
MEITPEIQAAIDEAVNSAKAGLQAKNQELLDKVRKLQKGQEIDPQTVIDLETKLDELKGELSASQKQAKEALKNLELTTKQLNDVTERGNKAKIDTDLTGALIAAGVKDDHYLTAVKALFSGQAKIGEDGSPLIGDKPLGEAIKEWGATDAAKHFQAAPGNAGGGSQGNNGSGDHKPDLSKLKPTDRINAAREAKT